jgi:hypothetical protein
VVNDWDNPYRRPIIGDAKGYYAYLPAAFIYQDFSYSFVEQVEQSYYPADGSLGKDFLVEQPNGTKVNKCFPGVSLFYLPFFLLAYFLSFLFVLPLDGYAPLFQWSIAIAHWFYFLWGLLILDRILRARGVEWSHRLIGFAALTFASNIFYYLVYDFSVAHVFGFFVCAYFIKLAIDWNQNPRWSLLGWMTVLLALAVIMRPTNALFVLMLPLLLDGAQIKSFFRQKIAIQSIPWLQLLLAGAVLFIPLLLWKIQTDTWLVYSYGEERMDFTNPHFFEFLFSVKKGWWFWSPIMFFMTFCAAYFYWKINPWKGIYFASMILFIAYVFSSWWMWTFGGGLGQRPMIDFYPILVFGFIGFLHVFSKSKILLLLLFPLILLNTVQAFQINKYILVGGQTTIEDYRKHFLQIKRDAPMVEIDTLWIEVTRLRVEASELNQNQAFSEALNLDSVPDNAKIVLRAKVGGVHESTNLALIISNDDASFYHANYVGNFLYKKPRLMEFLIDSPANISGPLKVYFWNHDSGEQAMVEWLELVVYEK